LSRDQKFFDMYSIVIGGLVILGFAFFIVSAKMANLTQGIYVRDGAEYQAAIHDRIRPLSQVYLPGEEHASASPTVTTPAEPEPVATAMSGPQVYNSACIACHGTGIGGAPMFGDKAQWADRIAQGSDVMTQRALQGYAGSTGYMPEKGGRLDLSDAEVEAAVDYIVSESQ
jgi:cytochrome c5